MGKSTWDDALQLMWGILNIGLFCAHVVDAGGASKQHLCECKAGAIIDVVVTNKLSFKRPYVPAGHRRLVQMNAGVDVRIEETHCCSQGMSSKSLPTPFISFIAACVCKLMRPGITMCAGISWTTAAEYRERASEVGRRSAMELPRMMMLWSRSSVP